MPSSSPPPPADAAGFFQNVNPFESADNPAADPPADDEEALRLAGVRSVDPWASGRDGSRDDAAVSREDHAQNIHPQEPVSPGPDAPGASDLDRTLTANTDTNASVPTSAISPGAAGSSHPDYFDQSAKQALESTPETDTDLHPANSNVNGDRAERGTDIYAITDPLVHEAHEAQEAQEANDDASPSGKDTDSESGHQDAKPRVAFAGDDTIDKAPTHRDSSPAFMDKVKNVVSDAKDKIHLSSVKASGPLKKMNPTSVKMNVRFGDDPNDVGIIWRSRDNRKGRNSVVVPRASMAYPNLPPKNRPVYSSSFRGVGRNFYRMVFTFPYWDMAFWSGWSYTWGSVLFTIDSAWGWIPTGWGLDLGGITTYGVGILFFIGALFYQVGATMAYLEAVNDGSFHGSAMKRFLEGHEEDKKKLLDEKIHNFLGHLHPLHSRRHRAEEEAETEKLRTVDPEAGWKTLHRRERPGSIYPGGKLPAPRRGGVDLGEAEEGESHEYLTWRWWPTWEALRNHHIYEIGYIACSVQLFGATLYTWCGVVSIPGISSQFNAPQEYGAYYFPEILGSCCFLTASLMFLLETQERWWQIQPNVVGWWIGVWAMVGSVGFLYVDALD